MTRGCKETGIKRIRIHDLRHSHVSLLIEMGYTPLAIAERLGHESSQVTLTYAHLFPNKREEVAKRLDDERISLMGASGVELRPRRPATSMGAGAM